MSEIATDPTDTEPKKGKLSFVVWLTLALVGAGAGFALVFFDLLPVSSLSKSGDSDEVEMHSPNEAIEVAFIDVPAIMITLNSGDADRQLRFHAQIEVESRSKSDVEHILPRIVDVMNSYLRALTLEDLRDPLALPRLRGQLLRRISIVTGESNVRDLLIMEFVLN